MKTKLDIEIPDELINQKIDSLTKENIRLKSENTRLKNKLAIAKTISEKANRIIEAVREAGGFCDDGCYGDH